MLPSFNHCGTWLLFSFFKGSDDPCCITAPIIIYLLKVKIPFLLCLQSAAQLEENTWATFMTCIAMRHCFVFFISVQRSAENTTLQHQGISGFAGCWLIVYLSQDDFAEKAHPSSRPVKTENGSAVRQLFLLSGNAQCLPLPLTYNGTSEAWGNKNQLWGWPLFLCTSSHKQIR